jgi:NH3-dependent NAD+ synthetase
MLRLNDAGAILWQAMEKDPTPQALVAALTAEYDVSEQQAREDVETFLQKLAVTGCLEQE